MGDRAGRAGVPPPRDANARRVMMAQRSVDTRPELALRRALHSLGFRYRVNLPIPNKRRRRADVTFVRWRTAVFVQGCFWHACPKHLHMPKHNAEWWWDKLQNNVRRDEDTDAHLLRLGWLPLRVWEHEVVETAVAKVVEALAHQGHPRAVGIRARSGVVISENEQVLTGP
ncbi:very short patch repair endonuclease [Saccharothrix sp. ST-888]|uniref:very short patch repair endonuclease n=1 Tax=Saccharothrix sp. ST-888 TaxID=1427391 RepID=UPI0009E60222|nr:very short patch repair endonuclease [Saccharothrix sp. ST-888]